MKSFLEIKRSIAILSIGIFAICIGAISKKVISYPAGGCMRGTQEMNFNKEKNKSQGVFIVIQNYSNICIL